MFLPSLVRSRWPPLEESGPVGIIWEVSRPQEPKLQQHQACLQTLPLPLFLHPRLETKGFKFWLRCSSRGTQTSTAGSPSPGTDVLNTHKLVFRESLGSRLPPWGVSALLGLTRWKPRWSDLSLGVGHLCHLTTWRGDGNGVLYGPRDTAQWVDVLDCLSLGPGE